MSGVGDPTVILRQLPAWRVGDSQADKKCRIKTSVEIFSGNPIGTERGNLVQNVCASVGG